MKKKVVIIGAGIAGLSAGVYTQRSGFDVTILEQHSIVGGMCTSWKRKGYLFEGAVHWLTGSSPKTEAYQLWTDTGALSDNVPIYLPDPFRSIEWEGQTIHLYRDIDKTVNELIKLSPEDEKELKRLAKDVKTAVKMQMPVVDIKGVKANNPKRMGLGYLLKIMPAMPVMGKYAKISCAQFVEAFKHPAVKRLLGMITDDYAATAVVATLATLHCGDGGYPEGGSLPMVHRMADTFKDLGGIIQLKTKVKKVNITNGKATGVTLEDGSIIDADAVIVTQETIAALDKLFENPPEDEYLKQICQTTKPAVCTFISLGVKAELPDNTIPEWELEEPIRYANREIRYLGFNSYREYAPEGGTALTTAHLVDTYDFWAKAKSEGRYEAEKEALGRQFVDALCKKYPQCEGKIEVVDVATPLTYERYTGAYRGSWMGVMQPGVKQGMMYPGDCKDIKSLYFAGHRMMPPGGLPVAVSSGRTAAQLVCRQFDAIFA